MKVEQDSLDILYVYKKTSGMNEQKILFLQQKIFERLPQFRKLEKKLLTLKY